MSKRTLTLRILETPGARTLLLDGARISGPGGEDRVVAEFTVDRRALVEAIRQWEMAL